LLGKGYKNIKGGDKFVFGVVMIGVGARIQGYF
jgi:hypothetical protein